MAAEQQKSGQAPFDAIRRKYLSLLYQYTNRNTILYATKWTQPTESSPELVSITDEDIQGFMEVVYQLKGSSLDLIIHSPGGSAEATEAIINYLRSKFDDIRVIIPQAAMSAATMLACASNRIVMGKHSSIGPIDPQFILQTPLGRQAVPAQAIIDQFRNAQSECQDPAKIASWLPILSQYGPGLLVQCQNAIILSAALVEEWLTKYMFGGAQKEKAAAIAQQLASHSDHKSHRRHISLDSAQKMGLVVTELEKDHKLQEQVLSVYHATMHTFEGTPAVKIIENHLGRAYVKLQRAAMVSPQPQQPVVIPGQQVLKADIELDCHRCRRKSVIQANFQKNILMENGRFPFPKDLKFKCECGNVIDISSAKDQLEAKVKKPILI
ncbi:MAG: serine protease [Bacteroidota bacterium]